MKKLILIAISLVTFYACSKKDTDNTLSKIRFNWQLDSIKNLTFVNNILDTNNSDTTVGVTGDYVDFRSDGKVYSKISENAPDDKDTATYTYSNNKISIKAKDGETSVYTITTLSSNELIFENKEIFPTNPGTYEQAIVKLKK